MGEDIGIAIYKTDDQKIELKVQLDKDTVWLDRKSIAQLFDVGVPAIFKHISNIYSDGELMPERTISKMEIVQKEGKRRIRRNVKFKANPS